MDIQEGVPVVFDIYEKEDGTRKSEYGRRYSELEFDNKLQQEEDGNNKNKKRMYEHVIRYDESINIRFCFGKLFCSCKL